jgi:hypothetical protein
MQVKLTYHVTFPKDKYIEVSEKLLSIGVKSWVDGHSYEPISSHVQKTSDVYVFRLRDIPFDLDEKYTIAALLPRHDALMGLWIKNTVLDPTLEFRLNTNSCVGIEDYDNEFAQLRSYRADIRSTEEFDKLDAELTERAKYANKTSYLLDGTWFDIDPYEITPAAGAGAFALVCLRDDTETRTALKAVHHAPTSQCTNVERAFARKFAEGAKTTAAHVFRSENGNYTGHFCIIDLKGVMHHTSIRQSTYIGMADVAIAWGEQL